MTDFALDLSPAFERAMMDAGMDFEDDLGLPDSDANFEVYTDFWWAWCGR